MYIAVRAWSCTNLEQRFYLRMYMDMIIVHVCTLHIHKTYVGIGSIKLMNTGCCFCIVARLVFKLLLCVLDKLWSTDLVGRIMLLPTLSSWHTHACSLSDYFIMPFALYMYEEIRI